MRALKTAASLGSSFALLALGVGVLMRRRMRAA
jgi:uncharacterized protein (TIGR03382 family)